MGQPISVTSNKLLIEPHQRCMIVVITVRSFHHCRLINVFVITVAPWELSLRSSPHALHEITPFEATKMSWKCHIFISFCCILDTF